MPPVLIPTATMPRELPASLGQLLGGYDHAPLSVRRYNLTWACVGQYLKLQAWRGHGQEPCSDVRCLCHEHAMTLLASGPTLRPVHTIKSLAPDFDVVTLAVADQGVDTETLNRAGSPLDVERLVIDLRAQVVKLGLAELCHLDMCPSNIVLGRQGYSLIDYGASRTLRHARLHGFDDFAYWNRHHGSPAYLCRVWLGGDPRNEDLWALAASAYHHLRGRPLLADTFTTAELRDHVRHARSAPDERRTQLANIQTRRALSAYRRGVTSLAVQGLRKRLLELADELEGVLWPAA